jgi:Rrf2 family transcriptional regulator, iron-sulfur cluster assembly transcription factor
MGTQRVGPQTVEDEEDDRLRVLHRRGQPVDRLHAHQRGRETGHALPSVVGRHSFHRVHATPRPAPATRDHGGVKVSTRGDYAARALLSLALHGSDRPTSVKEIAERTTLPQPYLEQILLAVKGAGLVRSKRGVGGGYVLARPPEEITLAEILAAVEGPLTTLMEEHDHCEGHCVLQEVWVGVSEETRQVLERFSLADLVERTRIGHPIS